MKKNVGKMDSIIRIALGVIIIVIGIYFKSWWGAIGLIPLITGIVGWCPLYVPFKISTIKSKKGG